MCLGIPGQILRVLPGDDPLMRMGIVSFGGVEKEVCLAYVPEAGEGDWVVVHAGFAISRVDAVEAARTLALIGEAPP